MNKIVVISPHPDDETLGCGGTLLKHLENGDNIYWIIVTKISGTNDCNDDKIKIRNKEINIVANIYKFKKVFKCEFLTAQLDECSTKDLVKKISSFINEISPNIIYMPFKGDIHSDHGIVFDAVATCTKSFRYPSVKRVLCYETLSETDFSIDPTQIRFSPNVFVNITDYIDKKIDIMKVYKSEMGKYPFPRSEEAIRSLAMVRGVVAGSKYAESFVLLREII